MSIKIDRLPKLAILPFVGALALPGCSDDDCTTPPPPTSDFSHADYFAENQYSGPNMNTACVGCHLDEVNELVQTGHWNWSGTTANLAGMEAEVHGKVDIINNFCIAIPSNEGRCTQCHIGIGYADKTFNFGDPGGVDCLVCHDTTGTYAKDPKKAGLPAGGLDWQAIAAGIGMPGRPNCGSCHYTAGGGDNVKHGDLAASLNQTTRDYDVHMGTDGGNFGCQTCHVPDESHGIGGMPLHSVTEGNMKGCTDCHEGDPHANATPQTQTIVGDHPTLSCQVCHIPTFARNRTTKVEWYWETAGDQVRVPQDVGDGRFDYDKMKGDFVWANNVRAALRRHNGTWNKMIIGVNDTYTGTPSPTEPVVLGEPATPKDPAAAGDAKIYPFKKMIGNQVADTGNQRILVPHLFGTKGGSSPYWAAYDWDRALQDGADYTGLPYSGTFGFVDTVMYLSVNHEVAPKDQALGKTGCFDCHGPDASTGRPIFDWAELGRTDPLAGGG